MYCTYVDLAARLEVANQSLRIKKSTAERIRLRWKWNAVTIILIFDTGKVLINNVAR